MIKRALLLWIVLIGALSVGLLVYASRPTPSPVGEASPAPPQHTSTPAPTAIPTVTPTATVDTSPAAWELLARGRQQQGIGDDSAIATFQSILERHASSPAAPEARYRLAEALLDAHRDSEALAALVRLIDEHPEHRLAAQALFLAGSVLRQHGRLAEAVDFYRRYLEQDDLIAGYVYIESATLLADMRQSAAAIASYQAALQTDLPAEYAQAARRSLARLAAGLTDYEQALQWWREFEAGARSATERAEAAYSIGLIQRQMGDAAAQATLLALVQTYPQTWYALQALETLLGDGVAVSYIEQGHVYYANRRNEEAMAAYRRYLSAYPDDEQAGLARYRLALLQQRLGNDEQAIIELDQVHSLYPNEAFVRQAWLEVARALLRLGRRWEAAAFYEKVAAWYPSSAEAEQALWEGALTYYRLGRADVTAQLLGRLRQAFPSSRLQQRAALWEAKSLLAGGDREQARQILTMVAGDPQPDYDVLRARQILATMGQLTPTPTPVAVADERDIFVHWLEGWAGSATHWDVSGDLHVQRGLLLHELRLYRQAAAELALARASVRDDAWALAAFAEYMQEAGLYYQMIAAANRLLALSTAPLEEAPHYLLRLLYPQPYQHLVEAAAGEYSVDALWLFALMRQESLFDRYAVSSAMARGLTQVIPTTAAEIAQRLGVANFRQEDLFKPLVSIRFGAWYLAQQNKATGGNLPMALAAYNGGLTNARRWASNQQGDFDIDLFVEDITFSETQAYVRLVFQYHAMYASLSSPLR